MKNRKHLILFGVVFLGFILGTIALNSQNNQGDKNEAQTDNLNQPSKDIDSKTPKISGFWSGDYIYIDESGPSGTSNGTWDECVANYDWCNKIGNIYVIENVTINATNSPTGCGIIIKYSDKPFIIRNCTVYNSVATDRELAGIKLNHTNNGNLTNNNCSNNQRTGILLYDGCYNNTISGNTVNNNGAFGIYLKQGCENNTISNNLVNDNGNNGILDYYGNGNTLFNNSINLNGNTLYGISLSYCENTELSGNKMKNCGIELTGSTLTVNSHTIFTNNTVNGKPVYYYADESDLDTANFTHAGEPGQIILAKCRDSIISSFKLSYSTVGIELTFSENITVSNNTVNYNSLCGIYLHGQCNDNTIFNNTANGGSISYRGIFLEFDCSNNNITGNTITDNRDGSGFAGLYLYYSDYNNITENTLESNYNGIYLRFSDSNRIFNNTANDNSNAGIYLSQSNQNTIIDNTALDNLLPEVQDYGIYLGDSNYNDIWDNTAKNNTYGLCLVDSSYNCISGNTLVNNTYNYDESGTCIRNRDCRLPIPPAADDDDDDDDDDTGIVIVIIIIVVLACIGAGGAIVFILIKKRHNRLIQT